MTVDSPNPEDQAATANCSSAVHLGAPFNESEQLGSHESASRINVETDAIGCLVAGAYLIKVSRQPIATV